MSRLFAALFPVLSGRVDTALLVHAQQKAIERLRRENALLLLHVEPCRRRRAEAHARLMAATRGDAAAATSSPARVVEEPTRAH